MSLSQASQSKAGFECTFATPTTLPPVVSLTSASSKRTLSVAGTGSTQCAAVSTHFASINVPVQNQLPGACLELHRKSSRWHVVTSARAA
jgi:hypothetical protein